MWLDSILRWICSYLMNRKQYVILNGEKSSACNATSGVPQGSVLGPLLFLMYINDSIQSTALDGNHTTLYADDMLLYRVINCPPDFINVQQGIDNIGRWVAENDLRLNSAKCKVMLISRRRTKGNQMPMLHLYGQPLERVFEYKYLGVVLSANLSWTPHIDKTVAKTRKIIGMLYRQFYRWSDPEVLTKLYTTIVRPHLEYAAPVWSPELIKDIYKLENVQKFALRVCTKQWDVPYLDLIEKCNLPELKIRRNCLGLGLLYKIVNEDCIFPNAPLVPYTTTYFTRSQSTNTFVVPQSRTNLLQNSFFPRTISFWNSLPPHITSSSSTASFKYHLLHHITN